MNDEILQKRIDDINSAIEQSALQHSMLMGRLEEAKYFLDQLNNSSVEVKPEDPEVVNDSNS